VPLLNIRATDVQDWLMDLSHVLSPGYVRLIHVGFGAALSAAVEEGLLASNPARSRLVQVPKAPPRRVQPWDAARIGLMLDALPPNMRALAVLAAGVGLRQGECFGLRLHDVDFKRAEVHVRQQITLQDGCPLPALPKYQRTRTVPASRWVLQELEDHLGRQFPLDGPESTEPSLGGLLFYSREKKPLNKNYFNAAVWRPALDRAGIPRSRAHGMHILRHTCASMWLEGGVSIKAVSEYLGHADPGFTLRVYTHVMPSSGERARQAMEAVFGEGRRPAEPASIVGAPLAHESSARGDQ
jgi:integrase